MKGNAEGNFRLGSNVVELLVPQKRPFLMVDGVESFLAEPRPTLEAVRHISANECVFDGHIGGLHVWPAAFTIEGLGQSALLLIAVLAIRRVAQAEGSDPDVALDALRNVELGFRLQPGYRPEEAAEFLRKLRAAQPRVALGTSVEMKFLRPVFAGQRLDYRVELTGEHAGGVRFEAEASVERTVVASGVMMGALVSQPIFPHS
jgi:3-hydroxymyristoyl/3-hydroxydecanoyl-(acyl carrier protein) dehydratase